jgi:hypothetical protein
VQTESEQVQHNEQRAETDTDLAAVLGPTLMALTASEAMNYQIWETQLPAASGTSPSSSHQAKNCRIPSCRFFTEAAA